jgi:hypothetical protein
VWDANAKPGAAQALRLALGGPPLPPAPPTVQPVPPAGRAPSGAGAARRAEAGPKSFPPPDEPLLDDDDEEDEVVEGVEAVVEAPRQRPPSRQQSLGGQQQQQQQERQRASDPTAAPARSTGGGGGGSGSEGGRRPGSAPDASRPLSPASAAAALAPPAHAAGRGAGGHHHHPGDASLLGPQEYLITCDTGNKLGAGTSARVRLQLVGTKATWVLPPLADAGEGPGGGPAAAAAAAATKPFQRAGRDVFTIVAPGDLGRLRTARLWLEGAGAVGLGGWLLARMEVCHAGTGRTWAFAPAAPGGWVPRGRNPEEGLELRAQALPPASLAGAFAPLGAAPGPGGGGGGPEPRAAAPAR